MTVGVHLCHTYSPELSPSSYGFPFLNAFHWLKFMHNHTHTCVETQ